MYLILGLVILLALHGCAMYTSPGIYLADRSARKEIAEQAKGADQVQTLLNLITMMETSVKSAGSGKGYDQPFRDLHNQFHAFDNEFYSLDKETRAKPAYDLAVTHNKELWAIFLRAWKFKDDQPQRQQHIELFAAEVKELRWSVETLK
ncbi:MAG TPA: hypothetical protein VKB81_02295 [Nitrospira sp.]|nr:hypothetical protein [Nitrospira sp.]